MLTQAQTDTLRGIAAEDVKAAFTILKLSFRRAGSKAAVAFHEGDSVSFMARGLRRVGIVSKINRNTVTVDCGGIRWRVNGAVLSRTADKVSGDGIGEFLNAPAM